MIPPAAPDSAEFEAWLARNRERTERHLAAATAAMADDDEAAWDALWQRVNALHHIAIAEIKRGAFEGLGCDPERSCLHGDHPALLARAFDIETPIAYEPAERAFYFCGDLGSPRFRLAFDIHTGRALPDPVTPPPGATGEWWAATAPPARAIFEDEEVAVNREWVASLLPPPGYDRAAPDVAAGWQEAETVLRQGEAQHNAAFLRQLGLDPRRSALFPAHGTLLCHAAMLECPLLYTPDERCFSYWTNGGPAVIRFDYDPFNGRKLPADLSDAWSDEMERRFGEDYWDRRSEITTPEEMDGERWWREGGL